MDAAGAGAVMEGGVGGGWEMTGIWSRKRVDGAQQC
jgi:hypothetical protein